MSRSPILMQFQRSNPNPLCFLTRSTNLGRGGPVHCVARTLPGLASRNSRTNESVVCFASFALHLHWWTIGRAKGHHAQTARFTSPVSHSTRVLREMVILSPQNMVLRRATAPWLEHGLVCHVRSLRCRSGWQRRGHRLFGNAVSFW